jgi:hypothetical protein
MKQSKKIILNKFESVTGFGQPDYIISYMEPSKEPGFVNSKEKCWASLMSSMPIDIFP